MDMEARLHADHGDELRLWLRMLTCTQLIEQRIRSRLRERFTGVPPPWLCSTLLLLAPPALDLSPS